MTTRRGLLGGAAAAIAASALAAPALAQGLIQWRMTTAWPEDLPGAGIGAQRLADRIGQLTGGRLTVTVHPGGEIASPVAGMGAVMNGDAEMAHDMASYYLAKSPAFSFFSSIPMGLTAQEHNAWLLDGGGQALWDKLGETFGLRFFAVGNTGSQLGGWFVRELASAADLKGLKIRVVGLAGQALQRLGVTQVLVPGADIRDSLASGALDAAEFMGPVNDAPFGFHKAAKFCYWPGFQAPCTVLQLQVAKAKCDALPRDHQAAIAAACAEENLRAQSAYHAQAQALLADLIANQGVQLRQFPADIVQAFGNAAGGVLSDMVDGGDDLLKSIASSYFAFRTGTLIWTRIGDQGFTNLRLLPYAYPAA